MNSRPQGNRWLERIRGGFAFLPAPMFMIGLILFFPGVTDASDTWHTFYGSTDSDGVRSRGVALDKSGNIYIAGYSNASWQGDGGTNPLHPHSGDYDIVVMKLSPTGAYQWHTFYGGSGSEGAFSMDIDGSGNVYIVGWSASTWQGDGGTNPLHPHSGGEDIVVLKLNSNGGYQWHTFYGAYDRDTGTGIALDDNGNVYVAGYSASTWQGVGGVNPLHPHGGDNDMAVVKLDKNGAYQWHTFYGGSGSDCAWSAAMDGGGNIYISGTSDGAWQGDGGVNPLHNSDEGSDIAVLKLNHNGAYQWHTLYGSPMRDEGCSIALDGNGNVYVTGLSAASWLGDGGADPLHPNNGNDIFIMKLNPSGAYQWHTFYGSDAEDSNDTGYGIAVDGIGNVYVTGGSNTSWQGDGGVNPLRPHSGDDDIVVVKLDSSGAYRWHTFYGSSAYDYAYGITADGKGGVYVAGFSTGTWYGDGDMPPLHAYHADRDITVIKLVDKPILPGEGTIGTQMTITGSGFGARRGKVLLGSVALKVVKWTEVMIQAILSKALPSGTYDVTIQPQARGSDPIIVEDSFTVKPPEIDSVEPSHGVVNDEITLKGLFGGTKRGKITLGGKNCRIKSWTMDPATGTSQVLFVVPRGLGAGTHELKITNGVGTDTADFVVE